MRFTTKFSFSLLLVVFFCWSISADTISPITISFEDQPVGPCCFADVAGGAQSLAYNFNGFTASFTGGVVLTGESNQSTDSTNVYATASLGRGLSNPLTVQFSAPVQRFQMDILNALAGSYTLKDNSGHSSSFTLANTGNSVYTQAFNTAGTVVTVAYNGPGVSGASFDFAIDNVMGTPSACAGIVNGAVNLGLINSGTGVAAAFTPNNGLTLNSAASQCGFSQFNWQQQVVVDPHPLLGANGRPLTPPYSDPPSGGYINQPDTASSYPYYFDSNQLSNEACGINGSQIPVQTNTTLTFCDNPTESHLTAGQYLGFDTTLVGILSDGSTEPLYNFTWTDNFNGTTGGASIGSARSSLAQVDLGSGTGGITITTVNGIASTAPEPKSLGLLCMGLLFIPLMLRKQRIQKN